MDDLDRNRQTQQSTLQADLKKEMGLLQKKILMDTQQQEMANVKKSLHSMLFQWELLDKNNIVTYCIL